MIGWAIAGLGLMAGLGGEAAQQVAGWAWEKVMDGIYTWLARGVALLVEWVWGVLESGTTPKLTAEWFRNELALQLGVVALAVTVAMMLASATQAALVGRPEQIGDAVRQGIWSIVASALTLTVVDILIQLVDQVSAIVWSAGRADLVRVVEALSVVASSGGQITMAFIGPLCLLVGYAGLMGLALALSMRMALIYVVAALAPLVWSSSVLPIMRGSARRLIHLLVALVVSKLAIVVCLVVSVKLIGNLAGDPNSDIIVNDAAAAVGTLLSGFTCFVIAAIAPWVLYKLMPTVEGAVASTGIAGGLGRSVVSAGHSALLLKGLGQGRSPATGSVPGQDSDPGGTGPDPSDPGPQPPSPEPPPGPPSNDEPPAPDNLPPLPDPPGPDNADPQPPSPDPSGGDGTGAGGDTAAVGDAADAAGPAGMAADMAARLKGSPDSPTSTPGGDVNLAGFAGKAGGKTEDAINQTEDAAATGADEVRDGGGSS